MFYIVHYHSWICRIFHPEVKVFRCNAIFLKKMAKKLNFWYEIEFQCIYFLSHQKEHIWLHIVWCENYDSIIILRPAIQISIFMKKCTWWPFKGDNSVIATRNFRQPGSFVLPRHHTSWKNRSLWVPRGGERFTHQPWIYSYCILSQFCICAKKI